MSWSDPERIKRIEELEAETAAAPARDPVFAASLARLEQMAASDDPADAYAGRLVLACVPVTKDWQALRVSPDIAATVAGAIGVVDGLATVFANLVAAVHPVIRPKLKSRFDQSVATTMRGIEAMLEADRRKRQ